MVIEIQGVKVSHKSGWLYADIEMSTRYDPSVHCVDCFNLESNRKPTHAELRAMLREWVAENYSCYWENA